MTVELSRAIRHFLRTLSYGLILPFAITVYGGALLKLMELYTIASYVMRTYG